MTKKTIIKLQQVGSSITSNQTDRKTIALKRPNKGAPKRLVLRQDYPCCDDPEYSFVIKHGSGKIVSVLKLEVSGGCPPYTWSVENDALWFPFSEVNTEYNHIYLKEDCATTPYEGDLVTVTDACGNSATCRVRTCESCATGTGIAIGGNGEDCVPLQMEFLTIDENYKLVAVAIESRIGNSSSYLIRRIINNGEFDDIELSRGIYCPWIYDENGDVAVGSNRGCSIYRYNDEYDRMYVEAALTEWIEVGKAYPAHTSLQHCGCAPWYMVKITAGTPPYIIDTPNGSITGYNFNLFSFPGKRDDLETCGYLDEVTVTDSCGGSKSLSHSGGTLTTGFMTSASGSVSRTYALNWKMPSAVTYECGGWFRTYFWIDTHGCGDDVTVEVSSNVETDGILTVTYADREITCTDGATGRVVIRTIRVPTYLSWQHVYSGDCCESGSYLFELKSCDVLLDSFTANINGTSTMEWLYNPDTVPAGSTGEHGNTLFRVGGGKPPYHWELTNVEEGLDWYDNVNLLYPSTLGRDNWVETPSASCGTFMITVTDSCGSVSTISAVVSGGAWHAYLEASVGTLPTGAPSPNPFEGPQYCSGNSDDGLKIRSLIMSVFGDSGLNDGTGISVNWDNLPYYSMYSISGSGIINWVRYRMRDKGGLRFTEIVAESINNTGTCTGYSPKPAWCYCTTPADATAKCVDRIADVGYCQEFGCNASMSLWDSQIVRGGWNDYYMRDGNYGIFFSEEAERCCSDHIMHGTCYNYQMNTYTDCGVACCFTPSVVTTDSSHTFWIYGFQVYIYGC